MDGKVLLLIGMFVALGGVLWWAIEDYNATERMEGIVALEHEVSNNLTEIKTYIKDRIDIQTQYVKNLVENQNLTIAIGGNASKALEEQGGGSIAGFGKPKVVPIP